MSGEAYIGTAKRTFSNALIHLLETGYGVLGSRRVLELMAEDIEKLVEAFYPAPARLRSGWMVFTGTKAKGKKVHPGQRATDHELVTISWPVLVAEDLTKLTSLPDSNKSRRKWFQDRMVRLIEYGWDHPDGPVLLTQADLAAMLGLTTVQVCNILKVARKETARSLATKGYYFDQGMRPTHKKEIIALYEQGADEADIARQSGHAQKSVGRYIRDYERVKLMVKKGTLVVQIPQLLGMQPGVVKAYAKMVQQYHPEPAKRAKQVDQHN